MNCLSLCIRFYHLARSNRSKSRKRKRRQANGTRSSLTLNVDFCPFADLWNLNLLCKAPALCVNILAIGAGLSRPPQLAAPFRFYLYFLRHRGHWHVVKRLLSWSSIIGSVWDRSVLFPALLLLYRQWAAKKVEDTKGCRHQQVLTLETWFVWHERTNNKRDEYR